MKATRLAGAMAVLALSLHVWPARAAEEVAEGADAEAAELAKQLSNPVASLISVPFQANEDFNMGPTGNGYQFKLNFQPVIPISVSENWNLIIRTIVPYISQHDVFYQEVPSYPGLPDDILNRFPPDQRDAVNREGKRLYDQEIKKHPQNRSQDGLGDTTQSFFLSPKKPGPGGLIWGLGPVFLYPTATQDLLGTGKFGLGPTFVGLVQKKGWTVGVLANQIWSVAGNDDRQNVNSMFLQPFVSYTTKTHTSFTLNTESTYNWDDSQWTVPLNLMVSQVLRIGKQPVSIQLGARYYAETPSGGPEWGLRLNFTLLFPKKHEAAPHPDYK
ncbi:MAG: transporter [Chthoniobacteraceae bacterium]